MYSRKLLMAVLFAAMLLAVASGSPLKADEPAAYVPLGKNVTLFFEIEGTGKQFSVMTASSGYFLESGASISARDESANTSGQQVNRGAAVTVPPADDATRSSNVREIHRAEFRGDVLLDDVGGIVQLSCAGTVLISHNSVDASGHKQTDTTEEVHCEFDASARLKPGEKRVLARSGDTALVVHVEVTE